ncbi:hypothetical protein SAMN04487786_3729 [Paenisporosarcina quisquiliarum]|nr:hypothetical protein SAMN04487786_3729 [Paenisporosarcina quisquiliarum]
MATGALINLISSSSPFSLLHLGEKRESQLYCNSKRMGAKSVKRTFGLKTFS